MSVTKAKWYATTGGKVGIVALIGLAITGIVVAVKRFNRVSEPSKAVLETEPKENTPKQEELLTPNDSLPPGKCDPVRTDFDRSFNYVKCDGMWYIISKDKTKAPEWKSLEHNPTAIALLNNKYPA